jgi:hypothetical protein
MMTRLGSHFRTIEPERAPNCTWPATLRSMRNWTGLTSARLFGVGLAVAQVACSASRTPGTPTAHSPSKLEACWTNYAPIAPSRTNSRNQRWPRTTPPLRFTPTTPRRRRRRALHRAIPVRSTKSISYSRIQQRLHTCGVRTYAARGRCATAHRLCHSSALIVAARCIRGAACVLVRCRRLGLLASAVFVRARAGSGTTHMTPRFTVASLSTGDFVL